MTPPQPKRRRIHTVDLTRDDGVEPIIDVGCNDEAVVASSSSDEPVNLVTSTSDAQKKPAASEQGGVSSETSQVSTSQPR